jgi:hypothetical protein
MSLLTGGPLGLQKWALGAALAAAPVLQSVRINTSNRSQVLLTYDKALNSPPPAASSLVFSGGFSTVSTAVSGQVVTATLSSAIALNQVETLTYAPGANPISAPGSDTARPFSKWVADVGANMLLIFWGQSNMSGEPVANLYTGPAPARTKYLDSNNAFSALVPGSGFRGHQNPEIHTIMALEAANPHINFYTCGQYVGGTGFFSGTGTWATSGSDRAALLQKINSAKTILQGISAFSVAALIGYQGEAETGSSTDSTGADASVYSTQLDGLISDVKAITGAALPLVFAQIHIGYGKATTIPAARDVVRQVHRTKGQAWIDVDSQSMTNDGDKPGGNGYYRHLLPAGYEYAGKEYAKVLEPLRPLALPYVAPPAPPPRGGSTDFRVGPPSAMPAPWTLNRVTTSFSSTTGVTLARVSPLTTTDGLYFAKGWLWDQTKPLVFLFAAHATRRQVGVSLDPLNWATRSVNNALSTADTLVVGRNGINLGTISVGSFTQYSNTNDAKVTLTVEGADIRVLVQIYNTSTLVFDTLANVLVANSAVQLANAYVHMESKESNQLVKSVVNV